MLVIEAQGARQILERYGDDVVMILLAPPDETVLERRLRERGDDDEAVIRRLEAAAVELEEGLDLAHATVVNEELTQAVDDVRRILEGRLSGDTRPAVGDSMADRPPTMMYPPVEDLLDKVDSKFTLVALAARRGRQINSYYNGLGSEGIGTIVPPQVASTSRKSLSIALEEIAAGKIQYIEPAVVEAALGCCGGRSAAAAEKLEPEA